MVLTRRAPSPLVIAQAVDADRVIRAAGEVVDLELDGSADIGSHLRGETFELASNPVPGSTHQTDIGVPVFWFSVTMAFGVTTGSSGADSALTLPAASVAVAVKILAPAGSGTVVKPKPPVALVTPVPTKFVPS